ncbi:hypothetical protein QCA50_002068 [Cerrena zonata]|uniref:BZIP domain-containing protein n=1 Tax=Cerrena zonata TaxID=2478898 RepID=A0AAW0GUJ5_9APHY
MSAPVCTPSTSSSSTLWATASKEWVIPAKPKPGRKPKKDVAPPVAESGEVDAKGRRVQNRAAQRAFRERKQSQLAELQARVQQYEQGEIERNVALQNIAKRLKEENEKLRTENVLLKEKLSQTEQECTGLKDAAKKRLREESLSRSPDLEAPLRKKPRLTTDALNTLSQVTAIPSSYFLLRLPHHLQSPVHMTVTHPCLLCRPVGMLLCIHRVALLAIFSILLRPRSRICLNQGGRWIHSIVDSVTKIHHVSVESLLSRYRLNPFPPLRRRRPNRLRLQLYDSMHLHNSPQRHRPFWKIFLHISLLSRSDDAPRRPQ